MYVRFLKKISKVFCTDLCIHMCLGVHLGKTYIIRITPPIIKGHSFFKYFRGGAQEPPPVLIPVLRGLGFKSYPHGRMKTVLCATAGFPGLGERSRAARMWAKNTTGLPVVMLASI